jgi:DNA-binding LytR/AlgR family response regulator
MSNVKILIVENESIISADIASKLTHAGFTITHEAANAVDALTSFNNVKPDLVLMDIALDGDTDGIETARQMKKIHPIPIVFLTDIDNQTTLKRAASAGPAAYLVKPFNERQVIASIHQALYNSDKKLQAKLSNMETKVETEYLVNDSLFIRIDSGHFKKIPIAEILFLEADGSYTHIYSVKEGKHTYSKSMNHVFDKLAQDSFIRISRFHVINLNLISEIKGNQLVLGKHELLVGEKFREEVLRGLRLLK